MNQQKIGELGEFELIKRLESENIPYNYVNNWVDFEIAGQKVDVKTCMLSHKFTNKNRVNQQYKIGRFHLTSEQRKNEIFLALFVRCNKEFLFLGIMKSKKDSPSYISIHKTREYDLYTLQSFYNKFKE